MNTKYLSYAKESFQFKLIMTTLLFTVITIALSISVTSYIFINILQIQNKNSTVRSFENTEIRINEILENINTTSFLIQSYEQVDNYLFAKYYSELEHVLGKREFIQVISHIFKSSNHLNTILFFKEDGTMIGYSPTWRFFYEDEKHPFTYTNEYKNALSSNHVQWIGSMEHSYFTQYSPFDNDKNKYIICGIRSMTYSYSSTGASEHIVVLLGVNEESLRQCFYYMSDENSSVCLLDANGVILADSDNAGVGTIPEYFNSLISDAYSTDKYSSVNYSASDGKEYQIIFYKMNSSGWILVKKTPLSLYRDNTMPMWITALISGFITIFLMAVLYSTWVKKFCKPLKEITESLERVKNGDLDVRIPTNQKNPKEIYVMQDQFNKMLSSINVLLLQKEEFEREKLTLEIRNLQAQITPHFIYNTITSIRWMATMTGSNKVADMLIAFVSVIRPIFSSWKLDWSLNEELEFIGHYIKLMNLRFGNMINIVINKNENTGNYILPRFTLQPLLENCCVHGMKNDQILNISIDIFSDESDLIITVADDGKGIPYPTLDKIKHSLENYTDTDENSNIGLLNINKRLKLHYGKDYGLTIDSTPEIGTKIEVRIPKKL